MKLRRLGDSRPLQRRLARSLPSPGAPSPDSTEGHPLDSPAVSRSFPLARAENVGREVDREPPRPTSVCLLRRREPRRLLQSHLEGLVDRCVAGVKRAFRTPVPLFAGRSTVNPHLLLPADSGRDRNADATCDIRPDALTAGLGRQAITPGCDGRRWTAPRSRMGHATRRAQLRNSSQSGDA
jgi:hypothetical protein